MSHVREIGGFVEGYVSEDFATAVKLAERGRKSRFIPIHTYEAMPENIRGFIKRQNKWTRGSMEFYSFAKNPKLSTMQRLLLLQTPMGHFAYIIILITMLLTVFGYYSTTAHLVAFAMNLWASHIFYILSLPIFRYVIATSIISGIILRAKLYQLGLSNFTLLKYQFLSKAIGAIMLPYEVKTILKYLANKRLTFSVTPKSEKALSFGETLSISKGTIFIVSLLIGGLVWMNPLGVFYNIMWLLPFFISPLVIYVFSKAAHSDVKPKELDFQVTPASRTSIPVTCFCSQPETVSRFLRTRMQ